MKAYSLDFRMKIIRTWQAEKLSIRQLAKRFDVAKSFVQKIIKQYQETKDVKPLPRGGKVPPKIQGEQLVDLIEIIEKNNDATLKELCDLLEEKTGTRVGVTTMWKVTQELNYSYKKKSVCNRKEQ